MRALVRLSALLALLAAGARATPPVADLPDHIGDPPLDQLLGDLKATEDALRADDGKLQSIMGAYADATSGPPGGAERDRLREDMARLIYHLSHARDEFHSVDTQERVARSIMLVFAVRGHRQASANADLQSFIQRADVVNQTGEFRAAQKALLEREQAAYQEASARYASDRARRRAAEGAAAALLLAAAAVAWRRRRPDASAPVSPLSAAAADRVGGYRLTGPGQSWAFGLRCDAVIEPAGRAVWLHVLDERFHPRPADTSRLAQALATFCAMDHAAVPELLGTAADGGGVQLVTAAASGLPLARWTDEGRPMPLAEALAALAAAAGALDAAHGAGRYHGALSPECILVGPSGGGTLLDLGVAQACAAVSPARWGLPAYAAPEAENGRPDPRSDAYALGVILYEAVTGRHPFDGPNLPALKRERRYAPAASVVAGLPESLESLLSGLLEPDPARRSPAPGGLKSALEVILRGRV